MPPDEPQMTKTAVPIDPPAKVCANCRFWSGDLTDGYRECDSTSVDLSIVATADDDSNLSVTMRTRATFGCTDFQPRQLGVKP